ncbi:sugar ABC transporter substrate-binding protein [Actinosynnema pretiosum subsp. pretiosum]|uniref:Extracellular solute-binding protein family 1 n=2 Tax=Actinosynnema TaxID=40566 RepID=C6W958_ACTMD|nr:sugar ABC transporter substrate-binding protein [Actinosynnema mirum]ACU39130.1 extracellular solute-binding protein family 1 [Actinosynnema mirum DSM 43827]AXX32726.1 Various polyols ABC transporter, periplasmic substrate-binding protein [Actinosynnema pretiosum subsp. pretiosum]QUF03394.1 sugar ABC transporter substrate-binding protein [Actinosynnema pretiosum subsp. pretiosum]
MKSLRYGGLAAAVLMATAACAGAGGGGGGNENSINVLMVNNPQMEDLQKLTADNFTKDTGITVNFTVLPENDVRDKISQDFSSQAGQYDVATISNYETPIYAKNNWLTPLDEYVAKDSGFAQDDVLESVRQSLTAADGKVYAQPFYGESSFLMYRKDIMDAKGITMPEKPTWQQVADIAAQVDGAEPGMKGICLRGQPGWGQLMAPLTTVVNTFGGTWFTKDWQAQVNSPEFKEATDFYVNLVRDHGENGAPQAGFAECLNNMTQGKVAMWYDATSAAGLLEGADSPVKGKLGFAQAPVVKTDSSGWLYTWAFGIQKASKKADNAWKFISWASGKGYEELAGKSLGWSRVPDGKRSSTYARPEYLEASGTFAKQVEAAISGTKPTDPGVQPRPAPGIQFVGIPEFTDLGTQVSQKISAAIAGSTTVEQALTESQALAETVAEKNRGK